MLARSMLDAKLAIARAASLYIKNEDFIALDAGTTSLELARLLPTLPLTSLGVVTPDLEIALLLSGCEHISVFLSGGLIDPVSRACNDSDAVAYLRGLRLTMLVIGAAGALNQIITDSGVGIVLKQVLTSIHISPLILACSHPHHC